MKCTLINPNWTFEGSIYFGCREPHLPLEYGYTKALLENAGHDVLLLDGQLHNLSSGEIRRAVEDFAPDYTVITTAPSYLFWRCAPPELRVPQQTLRELGEAGGVRIVVGPHGSTTPRVALRKLDADVVVMGECEEVVTRLVSEPSSEWHRIPSICYRDGDQERVQGQPYSCDMQTLPALRWPESSIALHNHHHHRFDATPQGPGAEMEVSRGCPYHCTFCAKDNFRNQYRKRPLPVILEELDALIAQGVRYLYFIDEIFLPNRDLLEALAGRDIEFGVQMRIDLWSPEMLDLLGRAGCVSIEAGVESITEEGRRLLDKKCRISTDELAGRLIHARKSVPFVQANLLESKTDDAQALEAWRDYLLQHGVWSNKPVPLFPYPGSPDYTRLWGLPDDAAWERAHEHYLALFDEFSDIQDQRPVPLDQLELC